MRSTVNKFRIVVERKTKEIQYIFLNAPLCLTEPVDAIQGSVKNASKTVSRWIICHVFFPGKGPGASLWHTGEIISLWLWNVTIPLPGETWGGGWGWAVVDRSTTGTTVPINKNKGQKAFCTIYLILGSNITSTMLEYIPSEIQKVSIKPQHV